MFAAPFALEALNIRLTGACGFALFPSSATEPDALVRLADAALYRAKAAGSGGVAVFDASAEGKAARTAAQWPGGVSLSLKLSAHQWSMRTTVMRIAARLEEYGLPLAGFEVEANAAAVTRNLDAARVTLEAVSAGRSRGG